MYGMKQQQSHSSKLKINCDKYQLSLMHCITANVLQTKVDAQCDKLATELTMLAMVNVFLVSCQF